MTNRHIYTTENLEETIKTIKALEAKINELDELKKEKETLIKKVLDDAGVEELEIGTFTVRFTNIVRNNFNTSAFKKKYLELYNAFIKQTNYRKFVISQAEEGGLAPYPFKLMYCNNKELYMGQRTAFLIKRVYWNGDVNIRLVHHQWGIGRVMHNNFIKDFLDMITSISYHI